MDLLTSVSNLLRNTGNMSYTKNYSLDGLLENVDKYQIIALGLIVYAAFFVDKNHSLNMLLKNDFVKLAALMLIAFSCTKSPVLGVIMAIVFVMITISNIYDSKEFMGNSENSDDAIYEDMNEGCICGCQSGVGCSCVCRGVDIIDNVVNSEENYEHGFEEETERVYKNLKNTREDRIPFFKNKHLENVYSNVPVDSDYATTS